MRTGPARLVAQSTDLEIGRRTVRADGGEAMSRRGANLIAVAYLVALVAIDIRFRLGLAGLALALVGFVAIVAWAAVGPRLGRRLRRGVRSALVFDQTERMVAEIETLLRRPGFERRVAPESRAALWRIAARLEQIGR